MKQSKLALALNAAMLGRQLHKATTTRPVLSSEEMQKRKLADMYLFNSRHGSFGTGK